MYTAAIWLTFITLQLVSETLRNFTAVYQIHREMKEKGKFYSNKLMDLSVIDKIQTEKASFLHSIELAKNQQANPFEAFIMLFNWFKALCLRAMPYYLWVISLLLIISHLSIWLVVFTIPCHLWAFYLLIRRKKSNLPF